MWARAGVLLAPCGWMGNVHLADPCGVEEWVGGVRRVGRSFRVGTMDGDGERAARALWRLQSRLVCSRFYIALQYWNECNYHSLRHLLLFDQVSHTLDKITPSHGDPRGKCAGQVGQTSLQSLTHSAYNHRAQSLDTLLRSTTSIDQVQTRSQCLKTWE